MARMHHSSGEGRFYRTPYEDYLEEKRTADASQTEKKRREAIAARHKRYDDARALGVPKSVLPDQKQIDDMSDKEWANVEGRIERYAPAPAAVSPAATAPATKIVNVGSDRYRVDDVPTEPANPRSLAGRASFSGFAEPELSGAGLSALVDSGTDATGVPRGIGERRVAVSPNAEQAMSVRTGGQWDNMTRAERTAYLQKVTGQTDRDYRYKLPVGDRGTLTVGKDGSRTVTSPHGSVGPVEEGARARAAGDAAAGEARKTARAGSLTPTRDANALTIDQLTPIGVRQNDPNAASNPLDVLGSPPKVDFVNPRYPQNVGGVVPNTSLESAAPAFDLPKTGFGAITDRLKEFVPGRINVPDSAPLAYGEPENRQPQRNIVGQPYSGGNPIKDAATVAFTRPQDSGKLQTTTTPVRAQDLDKDYLSRFATDDSYLNW